MHWYTRIDMVNERWVGSRKTSSYDIDTITNNCSFSRRLIVTGNIYFVCCGFILVLHIRNEKKKTAYNWTSETCFYENRRKWTIYNLERKSKLVLNNTILGQLLYNRYCNVLEYIQQHSVSQISIRCISTKTKSCQFNYTCN